MAVLVQVGEAAAGVAVAVNEGWGVSVIVEPGATGVHVPVAAAAVVAVMVGEFMGSITGVGVKCCLHPHKTQAIRMIVIR